MSNLKLEVDVRWKAGRFELQACFEVREGHSAVFGPSGSGKTTLLNLVSGISRPRTGRIVLDGRVLCDTAAGVHVPPERRGIGYVFQENRLFPHLTVARNLGFSPRVRQGDSSGPALGMDDVVSMLELSHVLERTPGSLSGGEARRVALGRALLSSPRLLMLDEPFTGLDAGLKTRLMPFLRRIWAETGIPTMTVSHSVPDILALADQVVVMDAGEVLAQGAFFDALRDERVFRLAHGQGLDNVLEVEIEEHDESRGVTRARLGEQRLVLPLTELAIGSRALVAIKPEEVILARESLPGVSAQNILEGLVGEVTPITNGFLVRLDIGQPIRVEVTEMARRDLELEPGRRVHAMAKTFSFRWLG